MKNDKNFFISLLLCGAVFVCAVSAAEDINEAQEQRTGETHFIIFAPNQFDYLHNAPEFQNGMRKISEQLARSEQSENNTVLLHGQADEPNRLGTISNLRRELERLTTVSNEDRIVVFVLTHGINANGKDYLADQKTSCNGFLSEDENEMIAVSEIVETLSKSPAEHKWVLIDSAAFELPIEGAAVEGAKFVIADSDTDEKLSARFSDDAFGSTLLSVPDNFVVSINRGRRIHQSADKDYVSSIFLRAFIFAISTEDRFSRHGQHVSLLDTLNTMNRFLAADDHPIPATSGSFNSNALLLSNRAESAGLIPISTEMWQYAIAQEIETASKLILLYHRPRDAVALLRQTEAQLSHIQDRDPQFRPLAERVRILRRMAQAMLGEAELQQAWQESQRGGEPLFLYVIHPPKEEDQRAMMGRLIRVSEIVPGGTTTTRNSRGQTVRETTPPAVKYDFAIRLRLIGEQNNQARKLSFMPIDSSRVGELPFAVFILGNANPVSPLLERAFNREDFDTAP